MDWTRREAMRWMTAAAGVGAVGGLGLPAWARRRRDEAKTILPWTKLRDRAWVTDESVQGGNVLVVSDGRIVVVVDSKFPHHAPALREDALALGLEAEQASLVLINTHHHADHTAGNIAFNADLVDDDRISHIRTFAHENAAPRIESQFDRYSQSLMGAPAAAARLPQQKALLPLATALADQADEFEAQSWMPANASKSVNLPFGPSGRKAYEKPQLGLLGRHYGAGHTDNDLVVHAVRENVIHTGDLIFNGMHPFFDANAGVTSLGWINSLNEIEKLCDDETIVVPGHGPVGDKSIVAEMRRYIEQLRESVKTDIGNGVAKEDMQAKTYDFMKGRQFDRLRPIAIGVVYDELTTE